MKSFTVEVGRLLRADTVKLLKYAEFRGLDVKWLEEPGLITSEFTVKGKPEHVGVVHDIFKKLFMEVG